MAYSKRKYGLSKSDVIKMIGDLYINKGLTQNQIAEMTGYSKNTVKRYIELGGYYKRNIPVKKDYIELTDNKVLYKNKIYKKLSKEEILQMFKEDSKKEMNKDEAKTENNL